MAKCNENNSIMMNTWHGHKSSSRTTTHTLFSPKRSQLQSDRDLKVSQNLFYFSKKISTYSTHTPTKQKSIITDLDVKYFSTLCTKNCITSAGYFSEFQFPHPKKGESNYLWSSDVLKIKRKKNSLAQCLIHNRSSKSNSYCWLLHLQTPNTSQKSALGCPQMNISPETTTPPAAPVPPFGRSMGETCLWQ